MHTFFCGISDGNLDIRNKMAYNRERSNCVLRKLKQYIEKSQTDTRKP